MPDAGRTTGPLQHGRPPRNRGWAPRRPAGKDVALDGGQAHQVARPGQQAPPPHTPCSPVLSHPRPGHSPGRHTPRTVRSRAGASAEAPRVGQPPPQPFDSPPNLPFIQCAGVSTPPCGGQAGWSRLLPPHHWHPGAETTSPVRAHEYDAATVRGMRAEDPGPYASPAERTLPTSSRAAGRRFLEPGGLPGPGPDGCGAPAGEPVFAGRFLNPVRTRAGVGLLSPARPPPGPCQAGRQQACQPELDRDGDHAPGHRPAASELRSRGPAQPRVRLHGQHSSAPHTSNKVPPHTVRHTYSSDRKQERKSNGGSDDHGRDIK